MVVLTQAGVAGSDRKQVAPVHNGGLPHPGLGPARGIVLGTAICFPFWAMVALVVRAWG